MSGNTTRHFPNDRRVAKRVPVLFSALLNRKGWRSQMVEVIDLSESGAKILLGFDLPAGSEVVLRMQGARRKLGVPAVIANCADERGLPVAGLRFEMPEDLRAEVREVVEKVDRSRRRGAAPVKAEKTKRRKRDAGGGA